MKFLTLNICFLLISTFLLSQDKSVTPSIIATSSNSFDVVYTRSGNLDGVNITSIALYIRLNDANSATSTLEITNNPFGLLQSTSGNSGSNLIYIFQSLAVRPASSLPNNESTLIASFTVTGIKPSSINLFSVNDVGNLGTNLVMDNSFNEIQFPVDASVVLPITLKSFIATKLEGSNALLNWTTSSERNASHFEIERSFDLENWQTLGQEEARGQHGIDTEYSYLDQNIIAQRNSSGIVYYRLQMVDIDGTRKTSDIRSINLDPLTETYYQAFPNPAKGTLNVQLQVPGTTQDMTSLFLIDNAGKLYSKTAISTNGITTLDVNDLPKGVYHLQVNTGQEVLTKKVILVQD